MLAIDNNTTTRLKLLFEWGELIIKMIDYRFTGWSVCSGTINRGCPEAVCAVMTKSFNP